MARVAAMPPPHSAMPDAKESTPIPVTLESESPDPFSSGRP